MIGIMVGAFARMVNSPIVSPSSMILFALFFTFILAAIIHPKEFRCLYPGVLYFVTLPSAFVLLNIYAIINLNNVSWGTREIKGANSDENGSKQKKWSQMFYDLIKKYAYGNRETCDVIEKIVVKTDKMDNETKQEMGDVKKWTEHSCLKNSDFDIMSDSERVFFERLIEKYLYPNLVISKEEIKENLDELRNKCSFYFLLSNSVWYLLLFTLQLLKNQLQDSIYININIFKHSVKYEPVYFSYVMLFVVMLILQFIAMIWHRGITFIQVIRKTSLRNCKKENDRQNYAITQGYDNHTFSDCGTDGKYVKKNTDTVDTILNF